MCSIIRQIDCESRRFGRANAFSVVELVVVISVIGVVMSMLIPALGGARKAAQMAVCASNLKSVGQLMSAYTGDYRVFPPAYVFNCPYAMVNLQLTHWSDLISDHCPYPPRTSPRPTWDRQQPANDVFTCPAIPNDGLPPANTPSGIPSSSPDNNLEPGGTSNNSAALWDRQARRMAFTVNEAISPRPFMQGLNCDAYPMQQPIPEAVRSYRFVRPSRIAGASDTILASEWCADWRMLMGTDPLSASNSRMCLSYSTVHGFAAESLGAATNVVKVPSTGRPCQLAVVNGSGGSDVYDAAFASVQGDEGRGIRRVRVDEVYENPPIPGGGVSRLNWLGRNHLGKTDFLYVDGHVEDRTIEQTVSPFQWGREFYSLLP